MCKVSTSSYANPCRHRVNWSQDESKERMVMEVVMEVEEDFCVETKADRTHSASGQYNV